MLFEPEIAKKGGRQPQPHQQLVTNPLHNLKKGAEILAKHMTTLTHRACVHQAALVESRISQNKDIRMRLSEQRAATVIANRKKLSGVVKTVLFLGRNNLPFRGHRDSGIVTRDGAEDEGVFRSALKFRINAGDRPRRTPFSCAHIRFAENPE